MSQSVYVACDDLKRIDELLKQGYRPTGCHTRDGALVLFEYTITPTSKTQP